MVADSVRSRRARVVERRRAGWKFADIARELGISSSRASQLYQRALADLEPPDPSVPLTLATPISRLPISRHARETLARYGVPLRNLVRQDHITLQSKLLQLPNCNRRVLNEIESLLEKLRSEE